MRVLTATGIIDPVGEDVYAHTCFSLAYLDGAEVEFFELWYVRTASHPCLFCEVYVGVETCLTSINHK